MTFFWNLDPVAFSIFGFDVRWYSLVYIFGFVLMLVFGSLLAQKAKIIPQKISGNDWENLIFWGFLVGIWGGRIGEFLFFSPATFWNDPLEIFRIWNGGMSIHGGLAAVAIFLFFWARRNKISFWQISDILVIPLAATLFLGRIANFLNGELVGVPTAAQTWGVVFPHVDALLRHPSQLYESAKNAFIFLVLLALFTRNFWKTPGFLTATFLGLYGIFRFAIEFFRDSNKIFFETFSVGQALCGLMILVAAAKIFHSK